MSDTYFANLPRFDTDSDLEVTNRLSLMNGKAIVEDSVPLQSDIVPVEGLGFVEGDMSDQATQIVEGVNLASLEATLFELSSTIDRVELEARDQLAETIQSLASTLFPKLSEMFLAEEIYRHMQSLVPVSVLEVEIQSDPALAEQLRQMMEREDGIGTKYKIVPLKVAEDTRVQVSWKTGGLIFDFDGLLSTCLTKLETTKSQ